MGVDSTNCGGQCPECKADTVADLRAKLRAAEARLVRGSLSDAGTYFPEVDRLRKRNREMHDRAQAAEVRAEKAEKERDEARAGYRHMVEHAADNKLDGYRELGNRAAEAERQRDAALAREKALAEDRDKARGVLREVHDWVKTRGSLQNHGHSDCGLDCLVMQHVTDAMDAELWHHEEKVDSREMWRRMWIESTSREKALVEAMEKIRDARCYNRTESGCCECCHETVHAACAALAAHDAATKEGT